MKKHSNILTIFENLAEILQKIDDLVLDVASLSQAVI